MNFQTGISLKPYNTFGLDTRAKLLVEVTDLEMLKRVLKSKEAKENPILLLGGGSNVLLCKDFDGLVIINQIEGLEVISKTDQHVVIEILSGSVWHDTVLHCVQQNWGGIENMSLIPGSVGAAPMQNIGAYGVELKDVFISLKALNLTTLELEEFDHSACKFAYRESVFKRSLKGAYFIHSITIQLTVGEHKTNTSYGDIENTLKEMNINPQDARIKDISLAVIQIRQSKLPDPKVLGNSGSFFKNPIIEEDRFKALKARFPDIKGYTVPTGVKVPAGWLIESLGWKGKRVGNTGSHAKQALVLVNYGEAKGSEIKSLAMEIISSVAATYQIDLTPEVNIIE